MHLLLIAVLLGTLSVGFFVLFRRLKLGIVKEPLPPPSAVSRWWMCFRPWRIRSGRSLGSPLPAHEIWDIYSKKTSLKAVRAAGPLRPIFGLLYAFFFHWWIPLGIWRYGWGNTLVYLLIPILLSAVLATIVGALLGFKDELRLVIGMLISAPLRGYFGVQISINDSQMRAETLQRRGWRREGQCTAESARKAKAVWLESVASDNLPPRI